MKYRYGLRNKLQTGALGVFVCVVLVIVFGLISLQNITSTSLDLYLSNSKQHIEEARHLAYAGLRHYTHNFGNDAAIQQLIDSHRGDTRVPRAPRSKNSVAAGIRDRESGIRAGPGTSNQSPRPQA